MSIDVSQYKVGIILSLEDCGKCKGSQKALRACKIRISGTDNDNYQEEDVLTVVTSAPNVRIHSNVVVAVAGSSVLGSDGEMIDVAKATVGGVVSEGMLCDSRMLGWSGGARGIAVNLPDCCEVGSSPPSSKPRPNGEGSGDAEKDVAPLPGLFEKKLTKEEKKRLAAEKRAKKKAAKEAKAKESA